MHFAKIAVVHPPIGWGGSDGVALWTLEALRDKYDLSFITSGPVDTQRLNEFYGTHLESRDFSVLQVPLPLGIGKRSRFAALRGSFIQRYCQRIAPSFDLMISAYNPCAFGVRGIQLVADMQDLTEILPLRNWKRWWYGKTPLRKAYLMICDTVSTSSPEEWKDNLTLVNSKWTAELMRQNYSEYGVETGVLYPPVTGEVSPVPFAEREKGFVCIGRVIPEKRMETVVEILAAVRRKGHNVHLHIIGGSEGNSPYLGNLQQKLEGLYPNWVFFEGRIDEEHKHKLVWNHRFGISGRQNEPFGMAVAEMVKAGCIVFVPDNGGQVEIVNHPDLVFQDVPDAVERIDKVLSSPESQDTIREHLAMEARYFSVEAFQQGIRNIVADFLPDGEK